MMFFDMEVSKVSSIQDVRLLEDRIVSLLTKSGVEVVKDLSFNTHVLVREGGVDKICEFKDLNLQDFCFTCEDKERYVLISHVKDKRERFIQLKDFLVSILPVSTETKTEPTKSTGGSSEYYKTVLPQWLLDKQKENGYIMLEDLAEVMYGNDFNFTNVMKAQKRMYELQQGGGKEGNTFEYDATKVKYYTDKQVEVFNR